MSCKVLMLDLNIKCIIFVVIIINSVIIYMGKFTENWCLSLCEAVKFTQKDLLKSGSQYDAGASVVSGASE